MGSSSSSTPSSINRVYSSRDQRRVRMAGSSVVRLMETP
jgi:hypothetical protein